MQIQSKYLHKNHVFSRARNRYMLTLFQQEFVQNAVVVGTIVMLVSIVIYHI